MSMDHPFHSRFADADLLPLLYGAEEQSGWGRGMRAVTQALLADVTLPSGPLLEVGCGGGRMLADLAQQHGDRLVCGVDLNPLALAHARRRLPSGALVCATLEHLPLPRATFAAVIALDVLDQAGVALDAGLAELWRLLRPGGLLLARVSAHPWLYGAHDRAFHTGQRFTRGGFEAALARAGFELERMTYINAGLAGPVAALRLAQRWGLLPWLPEVYQASPLNDLVARLLAVEAFHLRRYNLPAGLSLCALARRPAV